MTILATTALTTLYRSFFFSFTGPGQGVCQGGRQTVVGKCHPSHCCRTPLNVQRLMYRGCKNWLAERCQAGGRVLQQQDARHTLPSLTTASQGEVAHLPSTLNLYCTTAVWVQQRCRSEINTGIKVSEASSLSDDASPGIDQQARPHSARSLRRLALGEAPVVFSTH